MWEAGSGRRPTVEVPERGRPRQTASHTQISATVKDVLSSLLVQLPVDLFRQIEILLRDPACAVSREA